MARWSSSLERRFFGENVCQIVGAFDREFQQSCLAKELRLSTLCDALPEQLLALLGTIRERSHVWIERAIRELNLESRIGGSEKDDVTDSERLTELLAEATPIRLAEWGGAKRLLLTGPESLAPRLEIVKQKVQEIAEHGSNIVTDADVDMVLCYEVQEIGLPDILRSLIGQRYDYLDIAARLHSRIDVDWPAIDV